jgi:hypothetical protein
MVWISFEMKETAYLKLNYRQGRAIIQKDMIISCRKTASMGLMAIQ